MNFNRSKVKGNNKIIIYNFKDDSYRSFNEKILKEYTIKTPTQGLSEIFENGDFMVNETDRGRLVYFDKNGDIVWEYLNKFDNKVYSIGWTRVIQSSSEINRIKNVLDNFERITFNQ